MGAVVITSQLGRLASGHDLSEQEMEEVIDLLLQQLQPADFSRTCTAWLLLSCLVLAAAQRLSLSAVAAIRRGCPSRETLRRARQATLPDYDTTCRRLPQWLRASLPRGLCRRLDVDQNAHAADAGDRSQRRLALVLDRLRNGRIVWI